MKWRSFFLGVLCVISFGVYSQESFIVYRLSDGKEMFLKGEQLDVRLTPCSTFKIPLSLIGFDRGVLLDEIHPVYPYHQGYEAYLKEWAGPINPTSWMAYSCVWYSKLLAEKLSSQVIADCLRAFEYGNAEVSSGLGSLSGDNPFWIKGSLAISLREQALFLQKMLKKEFSISDKAYQMTRSILFKEELSDGAQLFGKTGYSGVVDDATGSYGYFVGWLEKNGQTYVFAYLISGHDVVLSRRVPRVKELLIDIGL
jgi:beta-lactamase class D